MNEERTKAEGFRERPATKSLPGASGGQSVWNVLELSTFSRALIQQASNVQRRAQPPTPTALAFGFASIVVTCTSFYTSH